MTELDRSTLMAQEVSASGHEPVDSDESLWRSMLAKTESRVRMSVFGESAHVAEDWGVTVWRRYVAASQLFK